MMLPELLNRQSRFCYQLLNLQDEQLYYQLYGSSDVMKHIAAPLQGKELSASFHRALALNQEKPFKRLFIKVSTKAVAGVPALATGLVGISFLEPADSLELGIMLLPAFQKQGLAAVITREVSARLIEQECIKRILVKVDSTNLAAKNAAIKAGFKSGCGNLGYMVFTGSGE